MVVGEDVAVVGDDEAGAGRRLGHGLAEVVGGDNFGGDAHGGAHIGLIDLGGGQGVLGGDVGYIDHSGGPLSLHQGGGASAVVSGEGGHAGPSGHAAHQGADQAQGHDLPAEGLFLFGLLVPGLLHHMAGRFDGLLPRLVGAVIIIAIVHNARSFLCFSISLIVVKDTQKICPLREETSDVF